MQKKNEILIIVTLEHLPTVAADNCWQRHFQTLWSRLAIGATQLLRMIFPVSARTSSSRLMMSSSESWRPNDNAHQFQTAGFRENQKRATGNAPVKS